jgi:hypothetical protein
MQVGRQVEVTLKNRKPRTLADPGVFSFGQTVAVLAAAGAVAARLAITAAALGSGAAVCSSALGAGGADALTLGGSEGEGGGGYGQRERDHAECGLQFRFHFHFLKICLCGTRLRGPARAAVVSRRSALRERALNPEVGFFLSDRLGVGEIVGQAGNVRARD